MLTRNQRSVIDREKIFIRPLLQDEWESFRDMRLEALTLDPEKFGAQKDIEEKYCEDKWQTWIESRGRKVFGLYDDKILIGITSVITWDRSAFEIKSAMDWPQGPYEQTAFFIASYICPLYRGLGLSEKLNRARLNWTADQPEFQRALTAHRASNVVAEKTHLKAGFVPLERQPYVWSDGVTEDVIICVLNLSDWRQQRVVF